MNKIENNSKPSFNAEINNQPAALPGRKESVEQVKDAIKNLIANARNNSEFVAALGPFWGDNSSLNNRLKDIMNAPVDFHNSFPNVAKKLKREAKEVVKLVKMGFERMAKPAPQEINRDVTLLDSALHKMFTAA